MNIPKPPEIEESYLKLIDYFERLEQFAKNTKSHLLNASIEPLKVGSTRDEVINYLLKLLPYARGLIFFPDEEIITKFKQLKLTKNTLRWFVLGKEILEEITRLNNIEGLYFLPLSYFRIIEMHLDTKVLVSLIEELGLVQVKKDGTEINDVFKDFFERYRRRKYNSKKNQTGKMNDFDKWIDSIFDEITGVVGDENTAKKYMLKPIQGDTNFFIKELVPIYTANSMRDTYAELFPLLKLIIKDKEMLSQEDFKDKDELYNSDYHSYKISRVKKFLQKE